MSGTTTNTSSCNSSSSFEREVAGRFGLLPNFFCTATAAPGLIEQLWSFAKSAYLDNPLPSLFKERLFVYLSRFCEVRYCIVRHAGFLLGLGRPAGDDSVAPHTVQQVLTLLRHPIASASALEAALARLESHPEACAVPHPETQREVDLLDALTILFLDPVRSERARLAARRCLGESAFEYATALLAFVRTAHYWTETHPELRWEQDVALLLEAEPELARLLLNDAEAEAVNPKQQFQRAILALRNAEEEQRELRQALGTSEERLRRLLETDAVAVLLMNHDGTLLDANDMFLKLTGYTRAEITRREFTWRGLTPPEWVALSEQQWQKLADTGRIGPYEKEYILADGSRCWFLFTGRDLGDGTVAEFCIDTTDRKRVEQALQEREAWLAGQRKALEEALTGAPLETSLGVLVRTATEQLGKDTRAAFYLADAEGKTLHHVVGMPADYAEAVDGFAIGPESPACGLATHTGRPVITPDVTQDPLWAPWLGLAEKFDYRGCWSFPVHTAAGKFVGTFALYSRQPRDAPPQELEFAELVTQTAAILIVRHTDALERTRAEAALRESEERYRTLFDSIDEGYCLVEVILNEEGRAVDLLPLETNPAYRRLTGLPNIVGKRLLEFMPPVEQEWIDFYGNVALTGQATRREHYVEAVGRWFTSYASRAGGEGSRTVAIVFDDITERKRREANQAFLVDLSEDLTRLSNEEEIMRTVGAKLAAHLNLTCYHYVDVNEERAEVTIRYFWHALDVPHILGTYPIEGFMPPNGLNILRAGESSIINDVQNDFTDDSAATAALKAGAAAQKIGAYVAVPYSQDGRWKAYFAAADSGPRQWTSQEVELIQEVSHRVWPRIERTRAEAALRASESRLRALVTAGSHPVYPPVTSPPPCRRSCPDSLSTRQESSPYGSGFARAGAAMGLDSRQSC